jgi:AsmA protein
MTKALNRVSEWMHAAMSRRVRQLLRFAFLGFVILLCLFAVFRVSAPFLVSSTLVRSGMERAVAQWTGHSVAINGIPKLEFWPTPRITLNDVTIRKGTAEGPRVLGKVEKLSASFGLYEALRGREEFYDFRFVHPHVFVIRDGDGKLDWTNDGLLSAAVRGAQEDGDGQRLGADLNAPIGSVTIDGGTLELKDMASDRTFVVDGIAAQVGWPRLGDPMTARLSARIGEQNVQLNLSSRQLLLLFGGKRAQVTANLTSPALTGRFEGMANLASAAFLSGAVELNATDIPTLTAWAGASLPGLEKLKSAAISAQLNTIGTNLRFNDLTFSVNDMRATGVMDVGVRPGAKPKLTGTLAFDKIDINAVLAAFALDPSQNQSSLSQAENGLLQKIELDVRLSAREATLAPFVLGDVGASVFVTGGQARFDIGDSDFADGQLTGQLSAANGGFAKGASLLISVRDAEFSEIVQRLDLKGPMPFGRGSIDLSMKTSKPIWAADRNDVAGKIQLFAQGGSMQNLDVTTFRQIAGQKPYFALSEAGKGAFDFDSLELNASFADGTAELGKTRLVGPQQSVTLAGPVLFGSNSLAVTGTLRATLDSGDTTYPPVPFFIGGSWPDPVISPVQKLTDTVPGLPPTKE